MRTLGLVSDNWISYMHDQGERVGLYRDYYDGYHPQRYSPEMRRLLQLDVVGDNSDGWRRAKLSPLLAVRFIQRELLRHGGQLNG